MSLTAKAVDRLIARVVNRLADRVPATTPFPVRPEDLDRALAKAMETAAKDRLGKILDDGGFDHRINDTLDFEIEKRLKAVDLEDLAKDRLDSIVEDRIDASGFDRRLDRAVEDLDLEEIAVEKMDNIDFEDIAKDVVIEQLGGTDPEELMKGHAKEFCEAALVARYGKQGDLADAQARASAEIIATATCRIVDAVNTTLEQDSEVRS